MSIRKKIFMLLIVLITISFLFSFSFASEKLKVGYFDDYPLLFDDNGKPVGFIVEILDEFAKNENYEIKYIYGTWAESLNRLKNGEIDLIGSVSQSEKRDVYFDFNENPLMMLWGTISVNSNFRVESILDLSGLKVGYIKNDYYAVGETGMIEIAKEFELDTEFISYDTYQEMFKAIEKNEVNAGITSDVAANQIYDYKNIKSTIINFAANGIKFATKNNENNEILKKLDENIYNWKNDKDSFYYKRYDFWFKDSVRNQYEIFYYENKYKILFFTLLTILTIMFSKFQVNYKTKELKEINKDLEKANFKIRASQTNIEASYENINGLVNQFENLVDFISRNMKSSHNESEESFLKELLKESFDLVKEADYGYVFAYNDNNELVIIETSNNKKIGLLGIKKEEFFKIHKGVHVIKGLKRKLIDELEKENSKNQIREKMEDSKESLVLIFEKDFKTVGGVLLEIEGNSNKSFTKDSKRVMVALKNIAENYLLNESFYKINEKFREEIAFSMIKMLEIHDEYTKGHSESVAKYSKQLAEYIKISDNEVNEIYWAALVHDVGKILIDKNIINKVGKLTNEEYEIIKKHPEFGYESLNKSKITKNIAKYVLYHHERIDGKGYPMGLIGSEIPFESKIIAIADSYDAMTSARTYKKAMSKEKALIEIEKNLDLQFDRELGKTFIRMMKEEDDLEAI